MKREKWFWLMLLLAVGAMLIISCEEVEDDEEQEEEELLDASRPVFGDPTKELPTNSALIIGSEWRGAVDSFSLVVKFGTSDCVFERYHYSSADKDSLVKYAYNFEYPTLELTLENDTSIVVIGTVKDRVSRYELTFVDANDSTVWILVETRI
jgi:hypothetical protein